MLKYKFNEEILREIASSHSDVSPEETPPNTESQLTVFIEAENIPVSVIIYPEFF